MGVWGYLNLGNRFDDCEMFVGSWAGLSGSQARTGDNWSDEMVLSRYVCQLQFDLDALLCGHLRLYLFSIHDAFYGTATFSGGLRRTTYLCGREENEGGDKQEMDPNGIGTFAGTGSHLVQLLRIFSSCICMDDTVSSF